MRKEIFVSHIKDGYSFSESEEKKWLYLKPKATKVIKQLIESGLTPIKNDVIVIYDMEEDEFTCKEVYYYCVFERHLSIRKGCVTIDFDLKDWSGPTDEDRRIND